LQIPANQNFCEATLLTAAKLGYARRVLSVQIGGKSFSAEIRRSHPTGVAELHRKNFYANFCTESAEFCIILNLLK
jgi:hypothetical protein